MKYSTENGNVNILKNDITGSSFCRGKSKDDEAVFQMSVKEKAEFVFDFLRQQKIER